MLNRRTPSKRTPFKRAAPTTKSHSNQAAALTSQALTAIKTRAPLRASTYAVRRELEPVWVADTRRKLLALGLWPKGVPVPDD